MLVSSADNLVQGAYIQIRPDITWEYLDSMMGFPKRYFEKKKSGQQNMRKKILMLSLNNVDL